MPDIDIDVSDDEEVTFTVDNYQLSDYIIQASGFSLALNFEQFEKLYFAIKPWFESDNDDV